MHPTTNVGTPHHALLRLTPLRTLRTNVGTPHNSLAIMSFWLGAILTAQTLLFFYTASDGYININASKWASDDDDYKQCCLWLQISISVEFLVLSCRTKSFALSSNPPSMSLFGSVMAANILCSVLALVQNDLTAPDPVSRDDVLRIWGYNVVWCVS